MKLRDSLLLMRDQFFDQVSIFFQELAKPFGFPELPGLPISVTKTYFWNPNPITSELEIREIPFPPAVDASNYFEIFVGGIPKPYVLSKVYYESNVDGYFNFYIENYKNIFFLPNFVSEFLQIQCNFCLDISFLEICRETLFFVLFLYQNIISLRVFLGWLIVINPYTLPFSYFIALVDWWEDSTYSLFPPVTGFSIALTILGVILGKFADAVNHLVFTMPYLPAEAIQAKRIVGDGTQNILLFKNLPYLWYKYPIPNEIRTYWYYQRPDILQYLQDAYKDLGVQFTPDNIIN